MESSAQPACVLTSYYRPKPGGLCSRLFRAINALLETGRTVHYLAVIPFPITHPKCHFHRFPWPPGKTDSLVFWAAFHFLAPPILLYLGYRHRVTHTFSFGTSYALCMQPLRRLKRIPLALFLRADNLLNHELKGRPRWLIKTEQTLEGLALDGVRLLGVSDALTEKVLLRHVWARPAEAATLRNNVDVMPVAREPKPQQPLRLACVGVLENRKNQLHLLNSIVSIRPDAAHLFYYGTGPDESKLRRAVKNLELTGQVHFMGWQQPQCIWGAVDLLLMPSLHEGAPNSVLEAMASGVPVLASDVAEHREILPRDCLLPPTDTTAWRDRLAQILADPTPHLREIQSAQRPYAEKLHFDWDRAVSFHIVPD